MYYPGICLERLRKPTKGLDEYSRCRVRDPDGASPEYKSKRDSLLPSVSTYHVNEHKKKHKERRRTYLRLDLRRTQESMLNKMLSGKLWILQARFSVVTRVTVLTNGGAERAQDHYLHYTSNKVCLHRSTSNIYGNIYHITYSIINHFRNMMFVKQCVLNAV